MQLLVLAATIRRQYGVDPTPGSGPSARTVPARVQAAFGAEAVEALERQAGRIGVAEGMARVRDLEVRAGLASGGPKPIADRFTPRERDVLQLVASGLTDRQIGERLNISPATVSKHVAHLLDKAEQPSRLALALWAAAQKLVGPDDPSRDRGP